MKITIIALLVLCIGCAPTALRKTIVQVDYEREQAQKATESAKKGLEAVGGDTTPVIQVQRRLDRQRRLLDQAMKAFPVDFTPTDDSYDAVYQDMAALRAKMEALRAAIEGLKHALKAPVAAVSGNLPLLGGAGGTSLLAILFLILRLLSKGKELKMKQQELSTSQSGQAEYMGLYEGLTGQISEQQHKEPGSMDELLGSIREKFVATGKYNSHEAALDVAGNKTTRRGSTSPFTGG